MKNKLSYSALLFGIVFLTFTNLSYAYNESSSAEVGRYLSVSEKPKSSQINLLSQSMLVRFPQSVQTIGDAMNYLLRFSGYNLVARDHMNAALKTTITKSLPAVDRQFGPVPLEVGLMTLAGPAFSLIQDPINRTVDFKLKPSFTNNY
jgi:type IV pili sensor histidine kinase/response regulator